LRTCTSRRELFREQTLPALEFEFAIRRLAMTGSRQFAPMKARSSGCRIGYPWEAQEFPSILGERIVNEKDSLRYKRMLLAKLNEVSSVRSGETLVPGAGGWQGDLVDQANSDAEAELHLHVHKSDANLLRAIEEALARIRRGTFGVCQSCEQAISKARLEAVPWTHLCRECKEQKSAK
jgi:DnaK suppressor protein